MKYDNEEITNIIYDTLMKNKQWPQLQVDIVEGQFVEAEKGYISFEYYGQLVKISIETQELE